MFLMNFLLLRFGYFVGIWSKQGEVTLGLILGQSVFAAILGGLAGRTWLKGFVFSSAFVSIAFVILLFTEARHFQPSFLPSNIEFASESALGLLWIPHWCLALALPCLAMRYFFGWSLTCSQEDSIPPQPTRLLDILLVIAIMACLLGMFRIPLAVWNSDPYDPNHLVLWRRIQSLVLPMFGIAMCTLFVGLPCTYVSFREKNPFKGFLLLALDFYIVFIDVVTLTNFVGLAAVTGTVMALNITLGLMSLRCGGVRLLGFNRRVSDDPMLATQCTAKMEWTTTSRKEHFVWTVSFVLFALVCSLSTFYIVSQEAARKNATTELQQKLQQELAAVESTISIRESRVAGLHLGPSASAKNLQTFPFSSEIRLLSINHSTLSTEVLNSIDKFSSLTSLDLGFCDIDERGLMRLTDSSLWTKLRFLSVAGTKMAPSCLSLLSQTSSPHLFLDLSNLGITDDDIVRFPFKPYSIRLSNNQITDIGVGLLFTESNNYYRSLLDLSNNSIDGSGFSVPCSINQLVLDGNPLTDDTFGPQLKNLIIEGPMVLSYTKLTDRFLSTLSKTGLTPIEPFPTAPTGRKAYIGGIELGDGNFTEEGVKNLGPMNGRGLSLTGKQFTGSCFKDWHPVVSSLSMRNSSINDETLVYVAMLTSVRFLDLSNTAISDSGLASSSIQSLLSNLVQLNVGDTRVTAKGLMSLKLPKSCSILLAPDQFKTAELNLLRSKWRVDFKENSPAFVDAIRNDRFWEHQAGQLK
jgi:hypothetical protein